MMESLSLGRREIGLSLIVLTLLALVVRLLLIGQAPMMDELYHLFAAKSWLADGELAIADGIYTRAAAYTKFIALGFGLFGEHIEVLRIIGVAAGVASTLALFLWVRLTGGIIAAWIAALLFCLWPDGISVSVTHRFYPLHGLFFFLGAISVYMMVIRWEALTPVRLVLLGLAIIVLFASAWGLQDTTLIGIAGVALWVGLAVGLPWLLSLEPKARGLAVVGFGLLGLGFLALLVLSGIGADLFDAFRWTPAWAASSKNQFWFYHALLTLYYPTLWSISGIAVIVAMAYRPRLIGFCLAIFIPAFVLHSLGGMKHYRYLYYVMPFLFVIWGAALAHVIERFWPFFSDAVDKTLDALVPYLPRRPLRIGLIASALLFTVFANAATIKTAALLAGVTIPPMTRSPDWDVAYQELEPWLDDAVILTTSEMETLYAFDRYDILISNSRMSELLRSDKAKLDNNIVGEFSLDRRTGRPVISEPESVELILSCFKKGVVVSNVYRWRFGPQLDDEVADVIEAKAVPINLPRSSMITAYRWENEQADRSPACAELAANYPAPPLSGDGKTRSQRANLAIDAGSPD